MEMQGLSGVKNTRIQHGAQLQTTFYQQKTAAGIRTRPRRIKNTISGLTGSLDLQCEDNSQARSSPIPVAENGSGRSLHHNQQNTYEAQSADTELGDVNSSKQSVFSVLDLLPSEFERADEHEDSCLQMALPLLDAESREQKTITSPTAASSKNPDEVYVVLMEDDLNERHMCQENRGMSPKPKAHSSPVEQTAYLSETSSKSGHLLSHGHLDASSGGIELHAVRSISENDPNGVSQTAKGGTVDVLCNRLAKHPTEESMLVKNSYRVENMLVPEMNIMDHANQGSSGFSDCGPDAAPLPLHESFSGTIMINNQNIIVTIENGVLTLATPPEGRGPVPSSLQDDPKTRLGSSDPEFSLDCSAVGLTLNSCTSVKPEDGNSCLVEDDQKSRTSCEAVQPINSLPESGLTKKCSVVKYTCPHPGCSNSFETRKNLKIHLVLHAEGQRPFKCTAEGCEWSFTTSYKLNRHLQSHDKVRPYKCEWENCGRRFTTVYNLKAHARAHDEENTFVCEVCSERFRTATKLGNHQRMHFEPERPHKCEFPGCEKTFITFSALFSHNRTHFRETAQFTCTYPGCAKRYDKACRLKIHLRSHTGERPFVCDSDSCGWTFTSMKHDDDRRFACPEVGCGKSFTRAEHLKGHSCNAKFSARSSLYIHSKKHKQDGVILRSRCPVAGCTKHFSSQSSLKTHMLKHHNLSQDALSQLDDPATLTPSSELTSISQAASVPLVPAGTELSSLDLSSLFSSIPPCTGTTAASVGSEGGSGTGSFSMDLQLINTGILTIDPASVGSALNGAKTVDPLILATGQDLGVHVLDTGLVTGGGGVTPHATLHLDDVPTVNPEELGPLTSLTIQSASTSEHLHTLNSTNPLVVESSLTRSLSSLAQSSSLSGTMPLAATPVPDLLIPQSDHVGDETPAGPFLGRVEVKTSDGMCQFVFPSHSAPYNMKKITPQPLTAPCSVMESSGSARTDYRAIQLAKRRKQKGPNSSTCLSETSQKKNKVSKCTVSALATNSSTQFREGAAGNGELPARDSGAGAPLVQIQLLQDDPAADGDLAFQLSSQSSCSHSQLTVDLPVNILQEPSVMTEDDNGSDNSQFTGSTINLQDLE
ncbi:hypothetical protein DNTS_011629 [Danionella cerebrum]|uniref:C2H2-type domain-containing protein n=1 Tax=Danionella cerebrum TaxID=2873325 RepID=A0A553NMM7_9TELE|nr:hypothetical protein DNTS_011629 [Danionella translucida]